MTQATSATVWEQEQVAPCLRCGEEMVVSPHVMGIELGPGIFVCHVCFYYVFDGSRARAAEALGRGAEGPDGGPAAPAAAALVELAVSAARSARPFTHLSELSETERAEYERWAAEVEASAPLPQPCARCGRPASPYQDTDAGPLCWKCWGPTPTPTPPAPARPDRADLAAVWVDTLRELAEAKAILARIDARLERIRARSEHAVTVTVTGLK
jgi:hypothetical protein